ncbi:hypothetical protein ACOMHN_014792 [Nucella lapillus]
MGNSQRSTRTDLDPHYLWVGSGPTSQQSKNRVTSLMATTVVIQEGLVEGEYHSHPLEVGFWPAPVYYCIGY